MATTWLVPPIWWGMIDEKKTNNISLATGLVISMNKQRITMSAIAAAAGVSQSTVSLVLNGSSAVKLSFRGNPGRRPTTYGWRDIARP